MKARAFWMKGHRSNCSKGWISQSTKGNETEMNYYAPKSPADLKRYGRMLTITVANASMCLNGNDIKSLKGLLRKVGEIS